MPELQNFEALPQMAPLETLRWIGERFPLLIALTILLAGLFLIRSRVSVGWFSVGLRYARHQTYQRP